jgi:hypothetical protein
MRRTLILGFLFTILFATVAYANSYAVVTGSRVNVRSYAEIYGNNRLFQVDRGEVIQIHGTNGDFFQATINEHEFVYISREWVRFSRVEGTVTSQFAWVYDLPGEEGGMAITMLPEGETVVVTSAFADWYGVEFNDTIVFMEQSSVEIPYFVELPTARLGTTLADYIVQNAKNYLGVRYLWGGTTPNGFDCSGFMVYLLSPHGISLHRRSRDQATQGTFVPRGELQRGDLVFFGSGTTVTHVGMYIGYDLFIHSSSTRSGGVIISNLNAAYNVRSYITARRVIVE